MEPPVSRKMVAGTSPTACPTRMPALTDTRDAEAQPSPTTHSCSNSALGLHDAPVLSYDPTTGDGISIPNWDFIGNAVVTDDCEDLDCSLVHPHLQLAHGAASSIFNRTALAAATHHQYQRNCWLTRSRFPVVALAPSQTSV